MVNGIVCDRKLLKLKKLYHIC